MSAKTTVGERLAWRARPITDKVWRQRAKSARKMERSMNVETLRTTMRRDGYGTELEGDYPGLAVRLDAAGQYVVIRDRDRATVVCSGLEVRGACAGLTDRIDGRLDPGSRRYAEHIALEYPLDGPRPDLTGRIIH